MNLQKRNIYIDILKAFAIICVVCGHCIQYGSGADYLSQCLFFDNVIFKVIYSFHMPLFMLISGYLFAYSVNKTNWLQLIYSRVKTLVIPIMIWSIIPLVLSLVTMFRNNELVSLFLVIKKYVSISLGNLWFLWAIFWCSLIVTLVRRFFKDSMIIYIVGMLLTFIVPDALGCHMYKFMYPFFVIGYFYNKNNGKEKLKSIYENKAVLLISGGVFIALLLLFNYDSYIYTSGYYILKENVIKQLYNDIYRFVIGLEGSIFIMLIFNTTIRYFNDTFTRIMCWIGRNTLGIYIVSGFVFSYLLKRIAQNLTTINYVAMVVEIIVILFFSLICTEIIKKSKLLNKFLLGGR